MRPTFSDGLPNVSDGRHFKGIGARWEAEKNDYDLKKNKVKMASDYLQIPASTQAINTTTNIIKAKNECLCGYFASCSIC
ncbi:MAG: hypothetical protein R3Y10_08870 [Ferrimonas sp.]